MAGIPGNRSPRVMLHKFQKKIRKKQGKDKAGFYNWCPFYTFIPIEKIVFLRYRKAG
jgi:hypothetical protein